MTNKFFCDCCSKEIIEARYNFKVLKVTEYPPAVDANFLEFKDLCEECLKNLGLPQVEKLKKEIASLNWDVQHQKETIETMQAANKKLREQLKTIVKNATFKEMEGSE